MSYKGFDIGYYPGNQAMSNWWYGSPFYFVGYYFTAPNHSDSSWMGKLSYLHSLGWKLVPLYVGLQAYDSGLSYSRGESDGADAINKAYSEGFSTQTFIYLDVEQGGYLSSSFINYIKGWCNYIETHTKGYNQYFPAIYCSYSHTADQIKNALGSSSNAVYWVYNLGCSPSPGCTTNTSKGPSSSGVSYAKIWQYAQSPQLSGTYNCSGYSNGSCSLTYNGTTLSVDLDLSDTSNPAND